MKVVKILEAEHKKVFLPPKGKRVQSERYVSSVL